MTKFHSCYIQDRADHISHNPQTVKTAHNQTVYQTLYTGHFKMTKNSSLHFNLEKPQLTKRN